MSGSGQGRGRGEPSKTLEATDQPTRYMGVVRGPGQPPVVEVGRSSSSNSDSNSDKGEKTIRGRGGFMNRELHMIPAGIKEVRAKGDTKSKAIEVLCNFIQISPMKDSQIYQYRIDFEPEIESTKLRTRLFYAAYEQAFARKVMYDGVYDARSAHKMPNELTTETVEHPTEPGKKVTVLLKIVGTVTGSFEMLRVYNINMKHFLRALGFYQIGQIGAYVHPSLATPIGNAGIMTVRGYRTSANVHEEGQILMNLESVHKLMQRQNVLEFMNQLRGNARGDFQQTIKAGLTGKLVVTNYNKMVYRIEDVNFTMSAESTFLETKTNREISYVDYYKSRHNITIRVAGQPLLLVVQNNKRRRDEGDQEEKDIYLIPELCNVAGLTEEQRNDNRLRIDLVKASQISPADRVAHLRTFLGQLHSNDTVKQILERWSYTYGREPVKIKARTLTMEAIGLGRAASGPPDKWTKADFAGSFDRQIQNETCAKIPPFPKMAVIIGRGELQSKAQILSCLKRGFDKIGLRANDVGIIEMQEGDGPQHYVNRLKNLPPDVTATIVILRAQNKERYDAIKKLASVELGIVTQVVTAKLMLDERKANGAALKIGVQIAAKIGGEPWYINLPLATAMICGYDTYHDTAQRGRSYGAFLASMNSKFSRWFSKADAHEKLDELSAQVSHNMTTALNKYRELNGKFPERVILYRDGVSDGQLEHVFNVELKQLRKACKDLKKEILLTIIIVNKRIGARFYMIGQKGYENCPPGSIIDDIVTRQERYDFYLISQSTRNGTVAPTYYNIIYDESGLDAGKHQAMAFKMCFLYYNWTGTVRVPAPCQYAHKLALLCGEHLHAVPNANLDDRLHFL